jgi:tripartite-type tricarboxylate transporter receptor subunit TctC
MKAAGGTQQGSGVAMAKNSFLISIILSVLLACGGVRAQEYPAREIHLVIGFSAGSGADTITRYFAEKLRVLSGKPVLVENKPGALGTLANTYVAKTKPDGYTIQLLGLSSLAGSVYMMKDLPVDPVKDFEPIIAPLVQPWVLLVEAGRPWKSLPELTAYLKEKKDKASYSSATPMAVVMGELYKAGAGLQMTQVNYKAISDSINDLLSGQIDIALADPAFSLGAIKTGKVRALATTRAQRLKALADVPTMTEGGVPMDLASYWGFLAPAGTPKPIIDRLNEWITEILKMEESEKFFTSIAADISITTPEQTRDVLLTEIMRWRNYVDVAKIRPN